ncbi:MAG: tape measure protein [Bacteroidaceae bacterium]|nr:tape measure protein [Bacteroidaceae bacterium]
MNTDQGRLFFSAGLDNTQLRADAQESRNILRGISDTAVQEGQKMESAFSSIATATAGIFAVGQLKEFTAQIISVRSEIEKLEISFETLLGSRQAGQQMFNEIRQFAVSTPMMLKDLAQGAQTMLGFNIEAEKVMPMLRAIGDISMGDAGKFNSLSLAFSQMSATGKLMGQDLLQMINAGFNPLSVISEKTGKSIGDLKEEMEKGKITVEMVTDAFMTATSAGGKFYGMLEKQSHGIAGSISNLQGAIDDMFNDIGTEAQGAIASTVGAATTIVKNYKEIGEVLAVIVATYGAYRAAIIATEAVRRSVTSLKHADEAAQLYAVMNAEQKARISKLGLSTSSEAYRTAVIAEMQAEMQRQTQIAQGAQVELTAARERLAIAESDKVAAAEKVAMRQAELEATIAEAAAEHNASITKRMATESEKQSRAALLAVKLQEQRQALINEAKKLKEAKADAEVIAAKQKQIAVITEKLNAARAEEVQCSRNVVALRKELAATVDATTSKKIAAAETRLETAQEELNTAAKVRNTAAREVSSKAVVVNTAAKRASAAETALETAATNANATATGFLTRAKQLATTAAAKLNAVIMANPWALAAAAVIALGYGIYKLITYQSDAEKAQQRLNEATKKCTQEIDSEQAQISYLFSRLKEAKEGTQEYEDAKQAIINQYGSYLEGLSSEIASLKDVEGAYKAVAAAAQDAARARAMEAYLKEESDKLANKEVEQKDKLYKELKKKYGDKKGSDGKFLRDTFYWEFVKMMDDPTGKIKFKDSWLKQFDVTHYVPGDPYTGIGAYSYTTNVMSDILKNYRSAQTVFNTAMQEAERKFGKAPEEKKDETPAKQAKTEAEYNKKDWEEVKKAKQAEYDAMTEAERTGEKGRQLAAEILKADKKIQGYNVTGNAKRGTTTANKEQNEANQIAVQTAERLKKIQEYADSVAKARREAEFEIEQAAIDAMQDGIDKQLRQNELNYEKLIFANQQRKAQMLEDLRDMKELEWENANPTAKKNSMVFDRSTIGEDYISQEKVDELNRAAKEAREAGNEARASILEAEATRIQGQVNTLNEYARIAEDVRTRSNKEALKMMLEDVMTYEQQRLKITEEFERKRRQLYEIETNTDGSFKQYKTDASGNRILRQGVTQGNADELGRQEEEALKAVDEQFAQRSETYKAWCETIADLSLAQLEVQLAKARAELAKMEKDTNADHKQVAVARASVNKLEGAVKTAKAKNDVAPDKKSVEEWKKLSTTLQSCIGDFEGLGEAVGGTAGKIISTVGEVASGTLSMIDGIKTFAQTSMDATKETAETTNSAVSAVEQASIILTVITTALKIATAIADLFNDDEAKQEEIERLQGRIDQLQWELDHQEITRYTTVEEQLNNVRKAIADTRKELLGMATGWQRFLLYTTKASDSTEQIEGAAKRIADFYGTMAYTADKAFGAKKYEEARTQLENIVRQQVLLNDQIAEGKDMKDPDWDKIKEQEQKIAELGQQAIELINGIVEDIIGGTSSDIAEQMADAFIDAFQAGEDAAEAWGDKVNEIVADILKRMLVSKFLEEPLGEIFNKYKAKWFPNGQAADNFLDVVINSMGSFANDLNAVGARFSEIWDSLPDSVKNMFEVTSDAEREASEKGIATASQESVDELNGRATAIQSHTYSIMQDTKALLNTTNSILRSVMNIESETQGFGQRMAKVESHLKEVKDTLGDISTKGIKIK